MNKYAILVLTLSLTPFISQSVSAESGHSAMVPLPSVDDFTRGNDGWSFGLGLGVEYETAYEGSDEFNTEVDPAGAAQWRSGNNIFYWAGEALGWRGLRANTWLFNAAVGFDEGREEGDSDDGRLDGLGDAEESTELVLQARRAFSDEWRYWLDGRVIAGDNGSIAILALGRRFGEQKDGTGSELSIAAVYHDSDRANNDFGVDTEQSAASGLAKTELDSGLRSIGIDYNYRQYISKNWQIFGEALYERFSSDIEDSPIARNNYEAEVGVGFIYLF